MGYGLLAVEDILVRTRTVSRAQGSVWLLHAFADSGLAYRELMDTQFGLRFDMYAPDFPGFGESPLGEKGSSLEGASEALVELLETVSPSGPVYLVAHSLSSVIATRVARRIGERVRAVVSIEGNLTAEDAYYSGLAAGYDSAERFKTDFLREILDAARGNPAFSRYYAGVAAAQPEAMMGWGRSAARLGDSVGDEFRSLECATLYYWGEADQPEHRRTYIETNDLLEMRYPGSGHWPMIDQPLRCSSDIAGFLGEVSEGRQIVPR